MKGLISVLPLLCLLGRVAGYYSHQMSISTAGMEYTYQVHHQAVGQKLQFNYTLTIANIGPNSIYMKPSNLKAIGSGGGSSGGFKVSQQFRRYFESPIDVRINGGVISSLRVNQSLPQWAVNLKRQLVTYFIVQSQGSQNQIVRDRSGQIASNYIQRGPYDSVGQSETNYQVEEYGLNGQCPTQYRVQKQQIRKSPWSPSQQPKWQQHSQNDKSDSSSSSSSSSESKQAWDDFVSQESFEGGVNQQQQVQYQPCSSSAQLYEITKTVDLNQCQHSPFNSNLQDASIHTKIHLCGNPDKNNANFGFSSSGYTVLRIQQSQGQRGGRINGQMSASLVSVRQVKSQSLEMLSYSKLVRNLTYEVTSEQMSTWDAQVQRVFFPWASSQYPRQTSSDQYAAQPSGYRPHTGGNQPQPSGYRPQSGGYQPQPSRYRPQPDEYQPQPGGHQSQPGGYQPQPNGNQPQSGGYQPQPGGHQSQPGGYQPQPGGYQPQPGRYQPQPGRYQPQPGVYTPAAVADMESNSQE